MSRCLRCKAWNKIKKSCAIGKTNPETLEECIAAYKRGGRGYVCKHNKFLNEAERIVRRKA